MNITVNMPTNLLSKVEDLSKEVDRIYELILKIKIVLKEKGYLKEKFIKMKRVDFLREMDFFPANFQQIIEHELPYNSDEYDLYLKILYFSSERIEKAMRTSIFFENEYTNITMCEAEYTVFVDLRQAVKNNKHLELIPIFQNIYNQILTLQVHEENEENQEDEEYYQEEISPYEHLKDKIKNISDWLHSKLFKR